MNKADLTAPGHLGSIGKMDSTQDQSGKHMVLGRGTSKKKQDRKVRVKY